MKAWLRNIRHRWEYTPWWGKVSIVVFFPAIVVAFAFIGLVCMLYWGVYFGVHIITGVE